MEKLTIWIMTHYDMVMYFVMQSTDMYFKQHLVKTTAINNIIVLAYLYK